MKIFKIIIFSLALCLFSSIAVAETNRASNWPRRGLRGGGLALDGVDATRIHPNDTAYVVDISGATAYTYVPVDTGSTTESTPPSILIITPDSLQAGGDDSSGGTTTWRLTGISGDTLYARTLIIDTTTITDIFDEDAMGSDSDTGLATQQSIKAYVDSQSHGGGGGGSGLTTMSTSDSSGARTEAEADTIGDAPGGMFLEFDPVSGGSGYGTGNSIYVSNEFLNQDVKTTATPSFSSVTPQAVYLDPIGEQTITGVTDALGVTGYSTMHITSTADFTLTTTPSIVGGRAGQILFIHNHGSFDIDLQDNSVLTGSSVFIGRSPGTIHEDSTMILVYSSKVSGFRIYSNPNTAIAGANATTVEVRNASGGSLSAGKVVHITGWNSGHNRVEIELADADDPAKYPALGFLAETVANNTNGEVIMLGEAINLIDTSGKSIEDGIWLSTTAGEVIFTRPTTDCIQKLGEVARVGNANASAIFVFGAGRCNDTPNEMDDVTGISVYAKPSGASGVSVFKTAGASVFQVDVLGAFVQTPTLPKHITDKAYHDTDATDSQKGIATFNTATLTVSSGDVKVATSGIGDTEMDYTDVTLSDFADSATSKTVNSTPSGNSDFIVGSDGDNWVGLNPGSAREAMGVAIGTDVQAWDAELDTIAALTETNGNVMFVAGGAWTSDATPAIDCSDCTNIPGSTGGSGATTIRVDNDGTITETESGTIADAPGGFWLVPDKISGATATAVSGGTIYPGNLDATSSQKGVATFNTANFSVSSGDVTVKSEGINSDEIADGTITTVDVSTTVNAAGMGGHIDGGRSALVAGASIFWVVPFNFGVTGFNAVGMDSGDTVSVKVSTGYQVPVASATNVVTSGASITIVAGVTNWNWASSTTTFKRGDTVVIEVVDSVDQTAGSQRWTFILDGNKSE